MKKKATGRSNKSSRKRSQSIAGPQATKTRRAFSEQRGRRAKTRRTHGLRAENLGAVQEKLLPAISAALGVGDLRRLKRYLRGALARGVPIENLEETILQCYLFAGFPAAIEGLVAMRQVCDVPAESRAKPEAPSPPLFIDRGERLCRKVYGAKFNALKRRTLELHPDLWSWMILEGYGKVLSRPPLTPVQRELCVIACLVVTGWGRQLRSHVRGALNVGCTPKSILEAIRIAGRVAGRWPLQWGLELAREEIAKAAGHGVTPSEVRKSAKKRPSRSSKPRRSTSRKRR